MSLMIDVDKITHVMLSDGHWYQVSFQGIDGPSSFSLGSYEYIQSRTDTIIHRSGQGGVCATGYQFVDANTGTYVTGPLTALVAVRHDIGS